MRDIRKKVLIESGKKTSRKARARPDSLTGSATHSPSPTSSPAQSNGGSRIGSRQASRQASRAGSRYASEDEDDMSEFDYGRLSHLSIADRYEPEEDSNDDSDVDDSDVTEYWQDKFQKCISVLEDRKRSSAQARVQTLKSFGHILRNRYTGEQLGESLPAVLSQLLKSIRRGGNESDEKKLALEALAITILSCSPHDSEGILPSVFDPVKTVCMDAESNEECKVAAIQALGVAVLFGGGSNASADELFEFLLDIVGSDGQSVEATDNAAVVTAALQMWTIVASYMIPDSSEDKDEDEDEDDEDVEAGSSEGQNSLVTQSQNALEIFLDQLGSTDMDVQMAAGVALGLLFEASRKFEAATDRPLHLTQDPLKLAQQIRELARGGGEGGSTKSTSRRGRRNLREAFTSVATSLELGRGPKYATSGRPRDKPRSSGIGLFEDEDSEKTSDDVTIHTLSGGSDSLEEFGYRERLQVGNQYVVIDTWAMSVRVDMLRTVLGSGLRTHLLCNELVADLLSATDLKRFKSDVARDTKKSLIKEKNSRRRKKGSRE